MGQPWVPDCSRGESRHSQGPVSARVVISFCLEGCKVKGAFGHSLLHVVLQNPEGLEEDEGVMAAAVVLMPRGLTPRDPHSPHPAGAMEPESCLQSISVVRKARAACAASLTQSKCVTSCWPGQLEPHSSFHPPSMPGSRDVVGLTSRICTTRAEEKTKVCPLTGCYGVTSALAGRNGGAVSRAGAGTSPFLEWESRPTACTCPSLQRVWLSPAACQQGTGVGELGSASWCPPAQEASSIDLIKKTDRKVHWKARVFFPGVAVARCWQGCPRGCGVSGLWR